MNSVLRRAEWKRSWLVAVASIMRLIRYTYGIALRAGNLQFWSTRQTGCGGRSERREEVNLPFVERMREGQPGE